jgi:arylsulfatase
MSVLKNTYKRQILFNMHSSKVIAVCIFLICSRFVAAQSTGEERPNIVLIFMDDMGYGDVGVYQRHQYTTPNIDALAANGMRFTNFYAAQAVCSASRAALLTGCYPNRIGITGALFPWSPNALNNLEETIANLLKSAGYKTGMVGKWHLGHKEPALPLNFGFDDYLGLPYSNDMWAFGYDGKPITDTADFKKKYPPLPLIDGKKTVKFINSLDDQGQLTQLYTQRAVSFIEGTGTIRSFCMWRIPCPMFRWQYHLRLRESPAQDCLVM